MALATRPSNVRVYQFHHPGGGRESDYSATRFGSQQKNADIFSRIPWVLVRINSDAEIPGSVVIRKHENVREYSDWHAIQRLRQAHLPANVFL